MRTRRARVGWSRRAPKTREARRKLLKRCGRRAFLDPDRLAFPVMAKTGPCVIDCQGAIAAYKRAKQYHHPRVAKRVRAIERHCIRTR